MKRVVGMAAAALLALPAPCRSSAAEFSGVTAPASKSGKGPTVAIVACD